MSLTGTIIGFVSRRAAKNFEVFAADAGKTQETLLERLLDSNKDTDYGRRYQFGGIRSIRDFQANVPIVTYEDIRPDIERVLDGSPGVLTAERPIMFAQTSGTTGASKFIPVTPTGQSLSQQQMRTWLWHAKQAHPDMFDGKIVSLASPAVEGYSPSGIPYGATSGHIYKHMPGIVKRAYSIPYPVFEVADYEAKYYAIMRIALEHDVRFVATANPSSILKMCEKANEHSEQLIRDVRDGTLAGTMPVDEPIRREISRRLRPNARRAQALDAMRRKRDGRLLPGDYWPNVRLIGCWRGGTVGHYIERFPEWFNPDCGNTPVRDWGYLASEARGSIPVRDETSAGVLGVGTNFFEFVPVDDVAANPDDASSWTCLTCDQIETGKEYYVLLTTHDGLYRYDINDVVVISDRYRTAPEIAFLRKGRGMTNLTGEKVSVNQVIEAVGHASEATGTLVDHFKAEADAKRSRYVLRVEPMTALAESAARHFLGEVDSHLKSINIEYKAKRDSGRLMAPVLHVMRDGWYERDRRAQVASGKRAFQAKTELLSANKLATQEIRPELLQVIELG